MADIAIGRARVQYSMNTVHRGMIIRENDIRSERAA
jgi:hypothetical protein